MFFAGAGGAGEVGAGTACMGTRFCGAGGCFGEFWGVSDAFSKAFGTRRVMMLFSRGLG